MRALSHVLASLGDKLISSVEAGAQRNPATIVPGKRKLVAIGSLYPGAGSTFIAVTLAKLLGVARIPNAVIESGANIPELEVWLQARGFRSTCAIQAQGDEASGWPEVFSDDMTQWVPRSAAGAGDDWSADRLFRLLYRVDRPVILVDISHQWTDPTVAELCRTADEIVVVAGPSPEKLAREDTRKRAEAIAAMTESGRTVQWIANRDAVFDGRKEWLSSLPARTICTIPELPYADGLTRAWNGRQRKRGTDGEMAGLAEAFAPLLNAWIGEQRRYAASPKRRFAFFGPAKRKS